MTLAFCWAHWRRRFYEIAKAGSAPIAEEALRRIAELYNDIAVLRQPLAERDELIGKRARRAKMEVADHRHRLLLRTRRARPHNRRADPQSEGPPRDHSITSSAMAKTPGPRSRASTSC